MAQFAQLKLSPANKIGPSLCNHCRLSPEGQHNPDTGPLFTFKPVTNTHVHEVCDASFSLSFYLFALSPAPSTIPVGDPLGQDLPEICPHSYFETVSDWLARPLTHFRLITPSLCDTNQL